MLVCRNPTKFMLKVFVGALNLHCCCHTMRKQKYRFVANQCLKAACTCIKVLVTFICVTFLIVLVITQPHDLRIGRNILQIDRTGLPELFHQRRTLYNSQEDKCLRDTHFETHREG